MDEGKTQIVYINLEEQQKGKNFMKRMKDWWYCEFSGQTALVALQKKDEEEK